MKRKSILALPNSFEDNVTYLKQLPDHKDIAYTRSNTHHLFWTYNTDATISDQLKNMLKRNHAANFISALIVIRTSNFRIIKENFGNRVGLELMRLMLVRLKDSLVSDDIIEQISEDEFGLVLNEIQDINKLTKIVKRLFNVCNGMYILHSQHFHIQPAIGIALYPTDTADLLDIARYACIALGQTASKNTYCHFFSQTQLIQKNESYRIEADLELAIKEQRMVLHYQPQYAINKGQKIIGMEALIRMIDRNGALVQPDNFISIAEANGMIIPIGHWVIHEACQQLKRWHDQGITGFRMAVNVSPRQLMDDHLIDVVTQAVADAGIEYNELELEITEQCILEHLAVAKTVLTALSEKGVRISLDDFGTGYSSLAYLAQLPLNVMKLDRVFLAKVPSEPRASRIVMAIIEMAKNMNLEVVAEGIESDDQNIFLEALNCQIGQGYGFSHPKPANELLVLLQKNKPRITDRQ